MRYLLPLCAMTLLAVGCAAPESEAPAQSVSSDLEDSGPATITFAADWSTHVTGALRAGDLVRDELSLRLDRRPAHRTRAGVERGLRFPAWSTTSTAT